MTRVFLQLAQFKKVSCDLLRSLLTRVFLQLAQFKIVSCYLLRSLGCFYKSHVIY